jgi:hypothetical protein
MSPKSTQTVSKHSTTSRLFGSGQGKNLSRNMTSETIADDIAAFKKYGGRIEVLGNTPLRTRTQTTAPRSSKDNPQTAAPGKASAQG